MMTKQEIVDKLTGIIAKQTACDEDAIVPHARLVEDLGADSLDVVDVVMEVETEFGITTSDMEMKTLATVQQIVDFIAAKKKAV